MSTEANRKYSFELLADYVDGILDPMTAASIEAAMEEDEDTRAVVEGIRFYYTNNDAGRDELETYLENFSAKLTQDIVENPKYGAGGETTNVSAPVEGQKEAASGRSSFGLLRIAAAIALLVAAGYIFTQLSGGQGGNPVVAQLEERYPGPVTTRSGDVPDGEDAALLKMEQEATLAYNTGDFDEAADLFFELSTARQDSDEWIFYNALSHLYDKEYADAIAGFEQLKSLYHDRGAPGVFNQQGEWYMSLALHQAGRSDDARKMWQKMADQNGHYKRKAATELLESTQ